MNARAFERHGVGHLSASFLNLWAAQPALWIMERLLGRRAPMGITAARGKAVEHGVHLGLIDPAKPIDECAAEAEREFNRLTALAGDPRRDEERPKIGGYVRGALAELPLHAPRLSAMADHRAVENRTAYLVDQRARTPPLG